MGVSQVRLSPPFVEKLWKLVTGLGSIYIGLGYVLGPDVWYQSPSLELVRRFVVPVPVWGTVMVVAGLLILTKNHRPWGHFIALLLWTFWFACIAAVAAASLIDYLAFLVDVHLDWGIPPIQGWGAPIYVLVYAMVHAHMLLGPRPVYLVAVDEAEAP